MGKNFNEFFSQFKAISHIGCLDKNIAKFGLLDLWNLERCYKCCYLEPKSGIVWAKKKKRKKKNRVVESKTRAYYYQI